MKALLVVLLCTGQLSVHVDAGEVAPFTGQLIADAEHIRREQVNERNVGELLQLKESKGQAVLPKPALIAIVAGALVVGIAVGAGAAYAAKK